MMIQNGLILREEFSETELVNSQENFFTRKTLLVY